jgi:asparagine synthetase B (glutamine-hydrolysing)
MFSGGLDSTIIACLLARGSNNIKTIDLVNVSFQAESSADRITSIFSFFELIKMFGNRVRMICADYSIAEVSKDDTVLNLLAPSNSHMDYNIGTALHYASRGEGYLFDNNFFETEEFKKLL